MILNVSKFIHGQDKTLHVQMVSLQQPAALSVPESGEAGGRKTGGGGMEVLCNIRGFVAQVSSLCGAGLEAASKYEVIMLGLSRR